MMAEANAWGLRLAAVAGLFALAALGAGCQGNGWRQTLASELPVLGHRNWIVVADSAYPAQTSPGIRTIATGEDQLTVVRAVFEALDATPHVRPNVYLDAELPHVAEASAPGIDAYRKGLSAALGTHRAVSLPHDEIIAKLDEAGRTFRVLILKTDLVLPYTSVFLELDCGYWNAEAESVLRDALKKTRP